MPQLLTVKPTDLSTTESRLKDITESSERLNAKTALENLRRARAVTPDGSDASTALLKDFEYEVRRGNIPGLRMVNMQGHGIGVGTSDQGMWGATQAPDIVALYDTPVTVDVASTSANDTIAGSGARVVLLIGMDVDFKVQNEPILMNGQTEVVSTKVYKAVTGLVVVSAGSSNFNEGDIWSGNGTFTSGIPATKYLFMDSEDALQRSAIEAVPHNEVWTILQLALMIGDTSKFVDLHAHIYDGDIQRTVAEFELASGNLITDSRSSPPIPARHLFWFEGAVSATTADVVVIIAIVAEDLTV